MADEIFTIGYEGLSLTAFIARLQCAGVKTVVDVRAVPLSRKRGFSKTAMASALNVAGIGYRHVPSFGCPKPVRDRYKQDGNWTSYSIDFLAHLKKQAIAINQLAQEARASPSCLVCFEADFDRCHRTFVARATAQAGGLRIMHLTNQTMILDRQERSAA